MALRRNLRRHRHGTAMKILKAALLVLTLLAAVITGFIIYFNGQHVKDPLLKLLSERSGLDVDLGEVEFSPIYPDTLKLHHVKFSQSSIDELYVEYDVKSLLSGQTLVINDLYLKDAVLNAGDMRKMQEGKLGFEHINIRTLRAKHVPVETLTLQARDASFELGDIDIGPDGITIAHGSGELDDGLLNGISYKSISGSFVSDGPKIAVRDLSLETLGGTISGRLEYLPDSSQLNFESLRAEKLLLKNPARLLSKYSVTAPLAELSHVIVVLDDQDLLLSDISGTASALSLNADGISFSFAGTVDEISKPAMQLTAEQNKLQLLCRDGRYDFQLQGSLFEGGYELDATADPKSGELNIGNLSLKGGKLEITSALYEGVKKLSAAASIKLNSLSLKDTSVLSHLDFLPVSLRSLSGDLTGFRISEGSVTPAPAGMISLEALDLLYSDLRVNQLSLTSTLNAEGIMLSVPKAVFGTSQLGATLSLSRDGGRSFALVHARDFELGSLNSSLIPHLMSGRVSFDADLKSQGSGAEFMQNLTGSVKLKGGSILISALGLDLINGGRLENFRLDRTQLLTALADSDCGLHDLNVQISFDRALARYAMDARLSTSDMELSGSVNLKNSDVNGRALFVSLPKDSITVVRASGPLKAPLFELNALSRGIVRPGLFVKSLTPEEEELQRRAREEMLVSQEKSTQEILDAVEDLKKQISVLEKDNAALNAAGDDQSPAPAPADAAAPAEKTPVETGGGSKPNNRPQNEAAAPQERSSDGTPTGAAGADAA